VKILGIVTLVSPLGEYGGPTRVAINQLAALRDRGHDVVLAGGQRGYGEDVPAQIEGVPARLFPVRTLLPGTGFAGLGAPGLWRAIRRHADEFDAVHIHAARDLVTLPAARIALRSRAKVVLQTHGMIDESRNPLAAPLDAALTRPVLGGADAVAYLTPRERASLDVVSRGRARLQELANGVPEGEPARRSSTPHVLYLARLAPRKRPVAFVQAATTLAAEFPAARFTLLGPDEGEGDAVRAAIATSGHADRIVWEGAVAMEDAVDRMRDATVYVLPSVDEPYPMSVLEAMSTGLPVVVTDTCGLAPFVTEHGAGAVVGDSVAALTDAVRGLLADPVNAVAQGDRARTAVREHRSMSAIAARLEVLYR